MPDAKTEGQVSNKAVKRAIAKAGLFLDKAGDFGGKIFAPLLAYSEETIRESVLKDRPVYGYALYGMG